MISRSHLFPIFLFLAFSLSGGLFGAALVNGPMMAHLEMRVAKIWVQTDAPALVRVVYRSEDASGSPFQSLPVETDASKAHTAVVTLDQIEPAQTYTYQIEVNGTLVGQPARFTAPSNFFNRSQPPNFRIAVGGAHYVMEEGFEPPYQTLGGGNLIFNSIADAKPDLMIWAGNTAHLRHSDWTTKTGYLKRFSTARNIPELKELLQTVPHYATWGAKDYGAPGSGHLSSFREVAEDSFNAFWPRPVEVSSLEGVATQFRYGDVDFFLLDAFSYRNLQSRGTQLPQMLGSEQIEWLRQALIQSSATFKVIVAGAPILNPADSPNHLSYADMEHTNFLQMLRDSRASGLFFISGGKGFGELTRLVHANSYNLHDLTVGPLTAVPQEDSDELNYFRMPGSSTFDRHFALIEFSGPEDARILTMRVMDAAGQELWKRSLEASSMQPAN